MSDLRTLGKAMRDAQRRHERSPVSLSEMEAMRAAEAAFDKALAAPSAKTPLERTVEEVRALEESLVVKRRAGFDFPCAIHRGPKGDCNESNCRC